MIQKWIESVFLKRAVLAFATGAAAHLAAHSLPGTAYLAAAGVFVTVKIDPQVFANWLTVAAMALSQGLHETIAAKYPEIGKYL